VPFEDIPLIDNHAHPWLLPDAAAAEPFARFFTEGPSPQRETLFYRFALRELAHFLGCAPDEASVVAARNMADFARRLVEDARVEAVLIDDGYPRDGAYSIADLARFGGFHTHRVVRLERLVEDLLPKVASLEELVAALIAELEAARPQIVAIKSIIAYRSGLAIESPDRTAAAAALPHVGGARLTDKSLLDLTFHLAAEWAADHHLPMHLHTGFGDRDLDLRLANPLHLRPLFERGVLGRSPVVLLHASYPFTREAGYLASVYPDLYIDVSEASPLLAGPALKTTLGDLLGLAPVTRLLYGSDAWGIPDWLWLAARATRRALADALAWLPEDEANWAARRILHDNAAELYGLSTSNTTP